MIECTLLQVRTSMIQLFSVLFSIEFANKIKRRVAKKRKKMLKKQCSECHCQCGYIDQPLQFRAQKPRTTFSQEQLKILEIAFHENVYPGGQKRLILAQRTGLPVDRIRVWFQNRRAKEKRLREDELAKSARHESHLNKNEIYKNPFEDQNVFAPSARIQPVYAESPSKSEEEIIRILLKRAKEKEEARRNEISSNEVNSIIESRKRKRTKRKPRGSKN